MKVQREESNGGRVEEMPRFSREPLYVCLEASWLWCSTHAFSNMRRQFDSPLYFLDGDRYYGCAEEDETGMKNRSFPSWVTMW